MRPWIIIVGLAFVSTSFLLQPASSQPGTGDLSGQACISDPWSECGQSLPGAQVTLSGGPLGLVEKEATTDDAGAFRFDDLPDGDYDLAAERLGFAPFSQEVTVSGATDVRLDMTPQMVTVAGQVLDSDGEPVARAYVSFHGSQWAEAGTDVDGRFEVDILAGWYEISVKAPKGFMAQHTLVDGSELVLDLVPPPGQDATVEGRVTDQDGQPVPDVDVRVDQYEAVHADGTRTYQGYGNHTRTGADGRYQVHVYGGSVSLSFSKPGHAHAYQWLELNATETRTVDIELLKYPEKTARIQGRVTDADGNGLQHVHVNMQHPEYGLWECSTSGSAGRGQADIAYSSEPDSSYSEPYPYHDPGCAITVHSDGTFTGNVTPGYAILQVGYDRWAACDETHHADGSYERSCGPDYYRHTQTLELAAHADTVIDVVLMQRPGADAAISGYVLDKENGTVVSGAHISFGHQDSYSWGSATTDGDGSYKVRVRSGYHHVSVWAEGFLPWEGTIEVQAGGETPLDISLTPGQARHGGCCYAYASDSHAEARAQSGAPMADGEASGGSKDSAGAPGGASSQEDFEDLGGGLGPYDASKRADLMDGARKDAPVPVLAVVAAIGLAAWVRRRG